MNRVVAYLALLGCAIACSDPFCTLADCDDGLIIEFTGSVPEAFNVRVTGPGLDPVTATIDCAAHPCGRRRLIGIEGETPSEITVEVTWGGQSATETFQPEYAPFWPNGPDCSPMCLQGGVRMEL